MPNKASITTPGDPQRIPHPFRWNGPHMTAAVALLDANAEIERLTDAMGALLAERAKDKSRIRWLTEEVRRLERETAGRHGPAQMAYGNA